MSLYLLKFRKQTKRQGGGPTTGSMPNEKGFQGSKTETRDLLGGTKEYKKQTEKDELVFRPWEGQNKSSS